MNIILDTNVLFSAIRSSLGASYRLLQRIDQTSLQLHISTPLVLEYEAALKRNKSLSDTDVEAVVDYLCHISEKHGIFYLWRPVLRDPQDDHILELAVKTNAMIITWNLKDFVPAAQFGLTVETPRGLLKLLENL
ncbi:MAG: putative toxin-antitoxin system toxin component, PIN family [Methylophilaceae bacterium]|nr:putative toxin-antitoxin system toxin component, PIN family [Methylophilaceae bacterium]